MSLLAKCSVAPANGEISLRSAVMEKRGEGGQVNLERSERLSSKLPIYRLLDESELMLTIFAAAASE